MSATIQYTESPRTHSTKLNRANYDATIAASYSSTHPASTATAAHIGDYFSEEQYRYALTNFVRTSIQYHYIFPLTSLPIPHVDWGSGSLRLSHIRRSRNRGLCLKNRSGRSHGSKHTQQRSRVHHPLIYPSVAGAHAAGGSSADDFSIKVHRYVP